MFDLPASKELKATLDEAQTAARELTALLRNTNSLITDVHRLLSAVEQAVAKSAPKE